ncbi:MAG TPA: VWA domain-containing protein [Terriglobales bacterium]
MKSAALLLMLIASALSAGQQANSQYTVEVDVNLVVLNVTVTNSNGIPVSGLTAKDFDIYEDGVRQQIKNFSREDVTGTVGLVIDNSSSMASKRMEVIDAARAFAQAINPHDDMFIVNFNEHVWFGLPHNAQFSQRIEDVETALSGTIADGQTALYDAVYAGLEHLQLSDREKKVLVVISDGGDNASTHKLSDVNMIVSQPRATIYTINLYDENDRDNNPGVLKNLAAISGGQFFRPSTVSEVVPVLHSIALDLGSQYTITYRSSNPKRDRKFRSIKVRVHRSTGERWTVRTRKGYYGSIDHKKQTPGTVSYELEVGKHASGTPQ